MLQHLEKFDFSRKKIITSVCPIVLQQGWICKTFVCYYFDKTRFQRGAITEESDKIKNDVVMHSGYNVRQELLR